MLRGAGSMLRSSARPSLPLSPQALRLASASMASPPRLAGFKSLAPKPSAVQLGPPPSLTSRANFSSKPLVEQSKADKEAERKLAQEKIRPDPEHVTSTSTTRQMFEPASQTAQTAAEDQEDVMKGVKADLNMVKETFSLTSVPREPLMLGLAGTLPYLATSLSTMYLSWDLSTSWPTSSNVVNSVMIGDSTATQWLHLLEPIQLGYGAVIISFLGAIHWGLEFAEKQPSRGRTNFRYSVGVLAPAVAWPTLLLPVEWALTAQFLAFTGLYFADGRATTRGWTPHWYGTYRFVLTFIVGSAIFISLVGRAKVNSDSVLSGGGHEIKYMTKNAEPYKNWEKLEEQEKQKRAIEKKKEEEEQRRKEEEEKKREEVEKKKSTEKAKERAEKEKEGAQREKEEAKSKAESEGKKD